MPKFNTKKQVEVYNLSGKALLMLLLMELLLLIKQRVFTGTLIPIIEN